MALQCVTYTVKLRQVSRLLLAEALDSGFFLPFTKHSKKNQNIKSKVDARNIQKAIKREKKKTLNKVVTLYIKNQRQINLQFHKTCKNAKCAK